MKVIYKCKCLTSEVEIDVPDRRPNTDILPWVEMVQACIGFDHSQLSPQCRRVEMEYMKLPMDGDQIGTPPTKQ